MPRKAVAQKPPDEETLPVDVPSLLAYQHRRLAETRADLAAVRSSAEALPRDIAMLRAAEDRALKAISELTGATRITEAKIVASDAWRTMFNEIVLVLSRHPAAVAELQAYLDSITSQDPGADAPERATARV